MGSLARLAATGQKCQKIAAVCCFSWMECVPLEKWHSQARISRFEYIYVAENHNIFLIDCRQPQYGPFREATPGNPGTKPRLVKGVQVS